MKIAELKDLVSDGWSEQAGSVFLTFMPAGSGTPQVPDKYPTSVRQVTQQEAVVLQAAEKPALRAELQKRSELRGREHFMNSCL